MKVWTKICGVTTVDDARAAVAAGADAVGINFYERSSRFTDTATAADIVASIGSAVPVFGVFVDAGRLAYLFDRSKEFFGVEKIPLPHAMQNYVDLNFGKDQLKEAVRKAQIFPDYTRGRQAHAWGVFRNFSKDSPERKLGQYITSIIGVLRMAKLEGTHTKVLGYMPDKRLPYGGE